MIAFVYIFRFPFEPTASPSQSTVVASIIRDLDLALRFTWAGLALLYKNTSTYSANVKITTLGGGSIGISDA